MGTSLKREDGRWKEAQKQGEFMENSIFGQHLEANCLNMQILEKQIPWNLATLALFLWTKILVGMSLTWFFFCHQVAIIHPQKKKEKWWDSFGYIL